MKKRLTVLVVVLFAFMMVGCTNVSINVFAYKQAGYNYRQINIVLPTSIYNSLNSTYNVERYFIDLCNVTDCGYEFDSIGSASGSNVIMLVKVYDPDEETDDFTSGLTTEVDRGFLFNDITISGKNPFDILRRCEKGEIDETYNDVAKIYFAIFNGKDSLKSIYEYYPMLQNYDFGKTELNFFFEGKKLTTDTNADSQEATDFKQFYSWTTTYYQVLMANADDIKYEYQSASSVGWYVVALVVGVLVVVVLWLIRRKSKEKGKEVVVMTPAEMYYMAAAQRNRQNKENISNQKDNVFSEFSTKKDNVFTEIFDSESKNRDNVFEDFDNDKDK